MQSYTLPIKVCEFRYVLGSGPGGQHINKTATTVELRVPLSKLELPPGVMRRLLAQQTGRINKAHELIVQASSHRSQLQNKQEAVRRVEKLIAAAYQIPKQRQATKPTASSTLRRVDNKKRRSNIKSQRRQPPLDN